MNDGTFTMTLEVGAARPGDCGSADLLPGSFAGFTTGSPANQVAAADLRSAKNAAKTWMQVWTVPAAAYTVATHRITQRPLERSP